MKDSAPSWLSAGLPHLWLPYAQMKTALPPLPVVSAEGCRIRLADGRELVDGIASWWSMCHGYRHPHIVSAMEKQLHTLSHIMFGGLAHEPACTLATRLSAIAPAGLSRVFFSDSGSVAVEVAMKMAVQFWYNKGERKRNKFLCFRHAYHGDTMGAMSLAEAEDSMHKAFAHYTPKQYIVDIPSDEYGFGEFEALLGSIAKTVAGMVIEPLVQGAGGMKFHSPDVLAELHRICKQYDILFIADEIATGFGRTGSLFACAEAGIAPDMLCLGKALTGGHIGLAATLATEEIFAAFLSDDPAFALMHGPTFMANPLACAAANASLDLFEREPRLRQVEAIERQLLEELEPCRKMPGVLDVRVRGAIGVVQIENMDSAKRRALHQKLIAEGVWLRPMEDVLYILPPLTITPEELAMLTGAARKVLST